MSDTGKGGFGAIPSFLVFLALMGGAYLYITRDSNHFMEKVENRGNYDGDSITAKIDVVARLKEMVTSKEEKGGFVSIEDQGLRPEEKKIYDNLEQQYQDRELPRREVNSENEQVVDEPIFQFKKSKETYQKVLPFLEILAGKGTKVEGEKTLKELGLSDGKKALFFEEMGALFAIDDEVMSELAGQNLTIRELTSKIHIESETVNQVVYLLRNEYDFQDELNRESSLSAIFRNGFDGEKGEAIMQEIQGNYGLSKTEIEGMIQTPQAKLVDLARFIEENQQQDDY